MTMQGAYFWQGKMRRRIKGLAIVQISLLAYGAWQIQQPDTYTQVLGWINIVTNIIGGAFNSCALQRRIRGG